MSRIDQTFKKLREQKRKAFIAFITAGDPDLKTTVELARSFESAGVDILELGVPFSDPLADGPTIQKASERALGRGVDLPKIFAAVKEIREVSQLPVCLMSYYNPLFHYGLKKVARDAAVAGVDGFIVPDLPPEEADDLRGQARDHGLDTVFFMAPTTRPERLKLVAAASTGFIYYVAVTGVTGARAAMPASCEEQIRQVRRFTEKPVCVGFGVSTPAQVRALSRSADGVIVGSAIVNKIHEHAGRPDGVEQVVSYVRKLTKPLKSSSGAD
jgi:tryptophan synthase alpha chain